MRSVGPDRFADDPRLRLIPTDPGGVEMPGQPHERPDRHPDVVPLRPGRPRLTPLHVAALLQRPVILLHGPTQYSTSPSRETTLNTLTGPNPPDARPSRRERWARGPRPDSPGGRGRPCG